MLVRLADWCYRRRRARRRPVDRRPGGLVRPGQRVRRGVPAGLPAARARSRRRPRTRSQDRFPQQAGDTVQIVLHSDAGVTSPGVQARAEKLLADVARERPRRRRRQPVHRRGRRPDLRGRHDRVRRRRAGQEGQRVHRRARPRRWSSRCWPPATTPCRSRSAARSRRCPRRRRSAPRASASSPRPSSCSSPSAPRWRWVCRCSPRCSASASRWRSARCCMRVVDVPDWAPADRRDGRHRRRHRLRAVHRHPVPQQPRRGPGAAPRHPDGDRDRRSRRAVRRPHRRRLDARHPADGPAGHDRLRLHGGADAAGRHGRLGDAAARRCSASPVATSSDCTCRS